MMPMTMKPHLQSRPPGSTSIFGQRAGIPSRRSRTLLLVAVLTLSSCASLSVKRDTETSGTFNSSARSFTLFSYAFPRPAIQIAHENIADAGLPNTHASSVSQTDWGWFDWVLELISIRSARVKGTWGFNGESLGLSPDAAQNASE